MGGNNSEVYSFSNLIWSGCTNNDKVNCPYLVDGIIYTGIEQKYIRDKREHKFPIYKYKPPSTNSLDVYITYQKNIENGGYLEIYDNSVGGINNKVFRVINFFVGDLIGNKEVPVPFMKEENNNEAFFALDNGSVRDVEGNLVNDETIDSVYTKQYNANIPLAFSNGEIDYKMSWYFGPSDYKILKKYDKNIEKIIPLGWGIFGWINMFIFIPLFSFLSTTLGLSLGIAIIIFTIIIKIAMSPITFKSFLSQAKMKVLRPEITELGEKFKKDPMKKQQETMKLYNKAGVNPMAGCIPALIQIPFMYASFQFFPSAFELRQKGFLWADDLSSFDEVVKLPFHIPLYGDHISLFPVLASIAIFFYMKMTQGDQQMAAPQQEGMPDMAKMMKIMIYLSPIMMLFFFNSYGAGLSLYNFISNLITIS
jgi:YidC/Oxa1 family membrane protein insertase